MHATPVAEWLVRWRYPLAILSLVLMLATSAGMQHLTFESDYKLFFRDTDPHLVAHEKMEDTYTKSDSIAFLIGVDEGDLFTTDRLQVIADLTEEMWRFPRAIRVDSITNFQHSEAQGEDDLKVYALFENPQSLSKKEIARRRAIALNEIMLVNGRVSEDGRTTLVNTRLEMPETTAERDAATLEIITLAREMAQQIRSEHPDLIVHLMGLPVIDTAFNESTTQDIQTLFPLMFVVILVLSAILLRSVLGTLCVLGLIVFTVPTTLGTVGWISIPLNQINVTAPSIIMTLCVCDAIHILLSHIQLQRQGMDKQRARIKALEINMQPVLLTSVTTAIGFLGLNFSDSPPFREWGNFVAMGVMYAWLFSLCLLPALMGIVSVKTRQAQDGEGLSSLANLVLAHRKLFFWSGLTLAIAVIMWAPRNELTDSTYQYFEPGVPVRDAADFLENRLTGFDPIAFSLPAGSANGVADPAYLHKLDQFAQWARSQPQVAYVSSFSDIIKQLNRALHGGDPAWYRIPQDQELAAQYLLLYELSLPFGLDLNSQLNFDKSASRFVISLRHVKAKDIIEFEQKARDWLETNAPDMAVPGSSVSVMFAHIGQNNIYSMLTGSLVALIGISLTLLIALRSWRLGLLSLIPNALPALMAFGLWGLLVAEVNLAVAAIFSITLGIVVDDSVHFLSKYLRARRTDNRSAEDAVRYAFSTVGSALIVTTTVLGLGFLVLALSDFKVNELTGLLTALTITIALAYDLLFLPALLIRLDNWLKLDNAKA